MQTPPVCLPRTRAGSGPAIYRAELVIFATATLQAARKTVDRRARNS